MIKVAKIVNKYGKSYMIPLFRAKEMVRRGDIDDFDIIEVEKAKNFEKPKTQKEFERGFSDKTNLMQEENDLLKEQIKLLREKQALESVKAPVTKTVTKTTDVIVKETSIDVLKKQADSLGIKYNPNIWESKLQEKISNHNDDEIKVPELI